jgi:hypothetical protein
MEPKHGGGILSAGGEEAASGAMEADPFKQQYWNLDQYLIWLASRDPAAVLRATDCPNSGTNPPIGWRVYQEPNVDRQKVEMEAVRAINGGRVKARVRRVYQEPNARVRFNRKRNWIIEFEGEPTALLMRTIQRGPRRGRRERVRPQFNPQSIARLYPAPTPSNIRDRPDDENPDVGPYIAYHDAMHWLAERISLRESLPIDEAGSRAEKTIRYMCMNTPEKLTMWGFRKADPDAELKPITPQAWQGLSINPLAGQPEADLKAVGHRREYGAATRGEYGPVIWTGLCFDRNQFDAAFVIGGGSEPPTHTPAAPPTQPRERTPRRQPLRERARRALDELYPNGVPDQINKSDAELVRAVNAQIKQRGQNGLSHDTILRAAGRRK